MNFRNFRLKYREIGSGLSNKHIDFKIFTVQSVYLSTHLGPGRKIRLGEGVRVGRLANRRVVGDALVCHSILLTVRSRSDDGSGVLVHRLLVHLLGLVVDDLLLDRRRAGNTRGLIDAVSCGIMVLLVELTLAMGVLVHALAVKVGARAPYRARRRVDLARAAVALRLDVAHVLAEGEDQRARGAADAGRASGRAPRPRGALRPAAVVVVHAEAAAAEIPKGAAARGPILRRLDVLVLQRNRQTGLRLRRLPRRGPTEEPQERVLEAAREDVVVRCEVVDSEPDRLCIGTRWHALASVQAIAAVERDAGAPRRGRRLL